MKFDEESQASYDWRMNMQARLEKIEADIFAMKVDIAFLKANSATKADLAETRSTIIAWVVGAVFLGQLLPSLLKLLLPG
ncbi:hypothetical protein E4L98_19860 [Duganella callida]|uniref:DUF1640 domain-containing protein n=2 Tax=Duganella callida TaxID=2561932 RepID=A0A4Y9SAW4_9BURK|nr:hypothetical protein E4L98_19860 [Duganella callida]